MLSFRESSFEPEKLKKKKKGYEHFTQRQCDLQSLSLKWTQILLIHEYY